MQGIRSKLTYGNVVATISLFLVLGTGVAFGAKQLINGSRIKPKTITAKQIKPKSLNGSLFAGGLPAGPQGEPGTPGPPGRSALSSLQSGETLTGVWSIQGSDSQLRDAVTLPIPAPVQIDSLHAAYQNNSTNGGPPPPGAETPAAAGCTGTMAAPVAAPGYVCIYANPTNVNSGFGYGINCTCASFTATDDGNRFGFVVVTNSVAPGVQVADGVWIYTAP